MDTPAPTTPERKGNTRPALHCIEGERFQLERQVVRSLMNDSPDFEELLRRLARPANSMLHSVPPLAESPTDGSAPPETR